MRRVSQHLYILSTLFVLATTCLLASCRDDKDEPQPAEQSAGRPGEVLDYSIILYIAGENTLSNYVALDLNEIVEDCATLPSNARVVAFVDDTRSSRLYAGTADSPLKIVKTYDGNICSTDSAAMTSILKEIIEGYPAKHYGLVLWSHASGWVMRDNNVTSAPRRSFGYDNGQRSSVNNKGPQMNIPQLANILAKFPHFEYILFDACFMQCVEVAYELRNVTDYIIGSPAEIPGHGAPYHEILAKLCSTGDEIGQVVDVYNDYYADANSDGYDIYGGVELSMVKTSKLEALAAATAPLMQQILAGRQSPDCSGVQRYNPDDTYIFTHKIYTEYFDLQHLIYTTLPAADYAQWLPAFEAAVPKPAKSPRWYSGLTQKSEYIVDPEHCGGVSIFVPSSRYDALGWNERYHSMEWYSATGLEQTGW